MSFYIMNFIFFLFYSALLKTVRIKNYNLWLSCFLITHISLISGLRSIYVGTDTMLYNGIYKSISYQSWSQIFNDGKFIGFSLLMKFFSSILGLNYNYALLLLAFLTISIIVFVVYKMKIISVFWFGYFYFTFYYFFQSMNISRQFLAISLCFLFFYLIIQKKYILSLLVLLIATSIHSTAIVSVIYIPLSLIRWNIKKYIILAIGTVIAFRYYHYFIGLFVQLFPQYTMYQSSMDKYGSAGNRVLLVVFIGIVLIFGIFISNKYQNIFSHSLYVLQSILIITLIMGLFYSSDQLITRIQIYFEIFVTIYIPMLFFPQFLNKHKEGILKYSLFIIPVATVIVVPFLYQLSRNYGDIIPYSIFFKQ